MPLTRATVSTAIGLILLALPWPAPMVGLAFVCVGATLGLSAAARASRRRTR
jgi:hypothetical protein